jgi:hypothetical protein
MFLIAALVGDKILAVAAADRLQAFLLEVSKQAAVKTPARRRCRAAGRPGNPTASCSMSSVRVDRAPSASWWHL